MSIRYSLPAILILIVTKLGLAPGDRDHRRVLAVLQYLETE